MLDQRRRRILWRAHHRGTKEADLLLGRFASLYIEQMDEAMLDALENFMQRDDLDVQLILSKEKPAPAGENSQFDDLLKNFAYDPQLVGA